MSAIFAKLERAQTSERTTHTMNELAKQGKWLGGNIPKWYVKNGEEISIDSSETRIIRNIFEEFVAGETKSNLSQKYDINESVTDYILRNAFYAGKESFGKRKKYVATVETNMSDEYLLNGLIKCYCGRKIYGWRNSK